LVLLHCLHNRELAAAAGISAESYAYWYLILDPPHTFHPVAVSWYDLMAGGAMQAGLRKKVEALHQSAPAQGLDFREYRDLNSMVAPFVEA